MDSESEFSINIIDLNTKNEQEGGGFLSELIKNVKLTSSPKGKGSSNKRSDSSNKRSDSSKKRSSSPDKRSSSSKHSKSPDKHSKSPDKHSKSPDKRSDSSKHSKSPDKFRVFSPKIKISPSRTKSTPNVNEKKSFFSKFFGPKEEQLIDENNRNHKNRGQNNNHEEVDHEEVDDNHEEVDDNHEEEDHNNHNEEKEDNHKKVNNSHKEEEEEDDETYKPKKQCSCCECKCKCKSKCHNNCCNCCGCREQHGGVNNVIVEFNKLLDDSSKVLHELNVNINAKCEKINHYLHKIKKLYPDINAEKYIIDKQNNNLIQIDLLNNSEVRTSESMINTLFNIKKTIREKELKLEELNKQIAEVENFIVKLQSSDKAFESLSIPKTTEYLSKQDLSHAEKGNFIGYLLGFESQIHPSLTLDDNLRECLIAMNITDETAKQDFINGFLDAYENGKIGAKDNFYDYYNGFRGLIK